MRARHVGQCQHDAAGQRRTIVRHRARRAAEHVHLRLRFGCKRANHARLAGADLAEYGNVKFLGARAPVEFVQFGLQCCRIRVALLQRVDALVDLRTRRRRNVARLAPARTQQPEAGPDDCRNGSRNEHGNERPGPSRAGRATAATVRLRRAVRRTAPTAEVPRAAQARRGGSDAAGGWRSARVVATSRPADYGRPAVPAGRARPISGIIGAAQGGWGRC